MVINEPHGKSSFFHNASNKASEYHSRVPYLRRLPFPVIAIIVTLILVNLLVWAAVGIVLVGEDVEFTCTEYMLTPDSTGTHHSYQQQFSHTL
jgi:antibiotic biosynthesis monooxygenase (ABM) superfamily enzyme